jgi:hypothetical protein
MPNLEELGEKTAKLANKHLSFTIYNTIEFVLLLSNGWRHATP